LRAPEAGKSPPDAAISGVFDARMPRSAPDSPFGGSRLDVADRPVPLARAK
jgi:hypothetical protein